MGASKRDQTLRKQQNPGFPIIWGLYNSLSQEVGYKFLFLGHVETMTKFTIDLIFHNWQPCFIAETSHGSELRQMTASEI